MDINDFEKPERTKITVMFCVFLFLFCFVLFCFLFVVFFVLSLFFFWGGCILCCFCVFFLNFIKHWS